MTSRIKLLIVSIILLGSILMSGCKPDPIVEYIQGMWSYDDPHLREVVAESHWIESWIFDNGSFANRGCCFGEVNIVGSYRVIDSDENSVLLELYDMQGTQATHSIDRDAKIELKIVIGEDGTLTIGSTAGYERIADAFRK